jgi:hypothetical protein
MRIFRNILLAAMLCGVSVVVALAVAPLVAQPVANAPPDMPLEEIDPPPQHVQALGARSCASTACHGSVHPDPRARGANSTFIRRDEYIVWTDHDPHARSLRTLESEPSRQMLAALGIQDNAGKIVDQRGFNNCLNCHATQIRGETPNQIAYESINCEACHGPAQAWRDTHYRAGWSKESAAQQGFIDNTNLTARSQACAKCHVGAADREVNHDLIAAGHPALKFEMAAYHELLPKHWNDAQERAATKNFERELWTAGQVACQRQALDLLAARALRQSSSQAAKQSVVAPAWPEFAEYDCFACHHALSEKGWYSSQAGKLNALPAWSPWYFPNDEATPELTELRAKMVHMPRIADAGLLAAVQAARDSLAAKTLPLAGQEQALAAAQWDRSVQAYLRLAAEFRARQDAARFDKAVWPEAATVKAKLLELRQLLAFPTGFDSPAAWPSQDRLAELIAALTAELLPAEAAP